MSQNVTRFCWSADRSRAACLLAEGRLTDEAIARDAGVTRRQLARWKNHPEFAARVALLARDLDAACAKRGIGRRLQRLRALDERWEKMLQVIAERAADPTLARVPGGPTGLLARTMKTIRHHDDVLAIPEYAVDTALLRELREHEKQAAVELGQWVTKVAPTNPDGSDEYGGFSDDDRATLLRALGARLGVAAPRANGRGPGAAGGPPLAGPGPDDGRGGNGTG